MHQIYTSETRSIQSGEKERAHISGRSGRGHLVLVCTERRRPRPLLEVNKLCPQHKWAWPSQIFPDVSEQIRLDTEGKAFPSD